MITRREWATAHHEAGHAAVGVALGLRLKAASVISGPESYGMTAWLGPPLSERTSRRRLELRLLAKIAGPCAERRYRGRWNWVGAAGDLDAVAELLLRLRADDARPYLDRATLVVDAAWDDISTLASRLVETGIVMGGGVPRTASPQNELLLSDAVRNDVVGLVAAHGPDHAVRSHAGPVDGRLRELRAGLAIGRGPRSRALMTREDEAYSGLGHEFDRLQDEVVRRLRRYG
jgi:hypothetical protein